MGNVKLIILLMIISCVTLEAQQQKIQSGDGASQQLKKAQQSFSHYDTNSGRLFNSVILVIDMDMLTLPGYLQILSFQQREIEWHLKAIDFVSDVFCEMLALFLCDEHYIKLSISRVRVRSKMKIRTDRTNIHYFNQ